MKIIHVFVFSDNDDAIARDLSSVQGTRSNRRNNKGR